MTDAPKDTVFPDTLMIRDTGIREDSGRRIHTTAGFGYKKISYTRTDLADAAERAAYLRGLEDAAKVADHHKVEALKALDMARRDELSTRTGCQSWSRGAEKIAAAIRALAKEVEE